MYCAVLPIFINPVTSVSETANKAQSLYPNIPNPKGHLVWSLVGCRNDTAKNELGSQSVTIKILIILIMPFILWVFMFPAGDLKHTPLLRPSHF